MWCVRYERPPSSIYSTRMVGLGVDRLGNRLVLSLHTAMQSLEKREAERAWGSAGALGVRPHPYWPTSPPPYACGLLAGPGSLPRRCLAWLDRLDGPSSISFA